MEDFEEVLRRFRPLGPPADLWHSIAGASASPTLAAWWPPAAAAAAALVLYALAANLRRDVVPLLPPPSETQNLWSRPDRFEELLVQMSSPRFTEEDSQP